jgi:hypothetical protein
MSKLGTLGKVIYGAVLGLIPPAAATAIQNAEAAIRDPNHGDKKKALADAEVIGSNAVAAINAIAGSDLGTNPKFQAIVANVNKVLHDSAKEIALLVDATDGTIDGQ